MAYLDDITTQRDSLVAAMTKAIASGPNHTVTDQNGSRTINSGDYVTLLAEQIRELNILIVAADPFDYGTRVYE